MQRIPATAICVLAAISLLATVTLLTVEQVSRHATANKQVLDRLEQAVRSDLSLEAALVSERDRQTQLSLRMWSHQGMGTVIISVSAVLFIASAKRLITLNGRPAMTLDDIRAGHARRHVPTLVSESKTQNPASLTDPAEAGVDLFFVDAVVAREGDGPEAAIPILQAIQTHYGYLPDEALKRVCSLTQIRPAQIAGVSTFYAQFRRTPAGRHIVKLCHGTACHVSGARQITEEIRRHLAIAPDADTDPQRMFTVDKVACLGCCSLAPVIMIDQQTVGRLTPTDACEALEAIRELEQPA